MNRYEIPEMLTIMGSNGVPFQRECEKLYFDNLPLFMQSYGATNNHQAWPGGYHDHVEEAMNNVFIFHPALAATGRAVPPIGWALLGLFLHDLEKPWAYEWNEGVLVRREKFKDHDFANSFRRKKVEQYGIELNDEMWNDIKHVEGDVDYTNQARVSSPLAALMHLCDHWSARGWSQHPLALNEPWGSRVST